MGQDRGSFLRSAGTVAVGLGFGGLEVAEAEAELTRPRNPKQALDRLLAGNRRFVRGKLTAPHAIKERRQDVAGGQKPFAILLTCADSRVPPEHVFDATLGEIFVCRVAGNIYDAKLLGSIEYSVANFHSHLLMVLGHQRCGAVKDTIKLERSKKKAPGHIQTIVDAIAPVVKATPQGSLTDAAYLDRVIRANVNHVARKLSAKSQIVRHAVAARTLEVVSAEYSLESGRVVLL